MAKKRERIRAKVTVGHYPDGTPIIKYAQGYSKKELAANVEELRRTYINGAVAVRRDVTFGEYAVQWFETYKRGNVGASMESHYRTALNKHLLPAFADRQMRAITVFDLQNFISDFNGRSSSLITDVTSVLRNVFALATAQGVIDRNPVAAMKRPRSGEPEERRPLTAEETDAALTLIQTHADGMLLALLYYTGVRRGEALGLQWCDVDLAARIIHVHRDIDFVVGDVGALKSRCSKRDVPMPDQLLSILRPVAKIGTDYILQAPRGGHWGQATYVRHWRAIQSEIIRLAPGAESEDGYSILTAHYFRHNYASLLYDAGVDVLTAQKWLGHAKPETTLRIYTHLSKARENDAVQKIDSAFSGNFLATFHQNQGVYARGLISENPHK